jgi:hypothetical protein
VAALLLLPRAAETFSPAAAFTAGRKRALAVGTNNTSHFSGHVPIHKRIRMPLLAAPFDDSSETTSSTVPDEVSPMTSLGVNGGELTESSTPSPSPKRRKPKGPNFRMQLFSFLNQPTVEVASASAVLLSSFLVAVNTLPNLPTVPAGGDARVLIDDALDVINIVFAIDFFLKWYAAGNFKPLYLTKPLVALDIFVVLIPLFLMGSLVPLLDSLGVEGGRQVIPSALQLNSAGLQNLLLLRILRLRRVLTDINTFTGFTLALGLRPSDVRPYQLQLARVLLSIFTLLSVASGLIYTTEHEVNPNIPDYFSALYFRLTTLTTVGFGDIAPITAEGRFVVSMSILAGVAIIPAQAANLVDAIVQFQKERKKGGPRITLTVGTKAKTAKSNQAPSSPTVTSLLLCDNKNKNPRQLPLKNPYRHRKTKNPYRHCKTANGLGGWDGVASSARQRITGRMHCTAGRVARSCEYESVGESERNEITTPCIALERLPRAYVTTI